jgi:lysophospholipase L1-like esterase
VRTILELCGIGLVSAYNETLARVCQAYKVDCLDMAALLPHDTTCFYDDCHLNEHGTKLMAKKLSRHLISMYKADC